MASVTVGNWPAAGQRLLDAEQSADIIEPIEIVLPRFHEFRRLDQRNPTVRRDGIEKMRRFHRLSPRRVAGGI